MNPTAGTVQTVLGPLDPGDLGLTLIHEHVFIDLVAGATNASEAAAKLRGHAMFHAGVREEPAGTDLSSTARSRWDQEITLINRGDALANYRLYRRAFQQLSLEHALHEVAHFRAKGGGAIADATPIGLGRDPAGLEEVSRVTGVPIVMGGGYYTQPFHPAYVAEMAEAHLYERMVADVTEGPVRAGMIGEVASNWPMHPDEEKVLRAAARAAAETGVLLSVHPGHPPTACHETLRIVEDAGGDVGHTVMGHVDARIYDTEGHLELARTGCYIAFDAFGREANSFRQLGPVDVPNDAQRINWLVALADAGFADRLAVGMDLAIQPYTHEFGGFGYAHIPTNVRRLMRAKAVDENLIDRILVTNPAEMLTVH